MKNGKKKIKGSVSTYRGGGMYKKVMNNTPIPVYKQGGPINFSKAMKACRKKRSRG